MPFDSREYVVHFRLIQPVEKGGGGGGGCADAVPFRPIQSISGGGGGLLSALVRFNQGGGGGSVPFRLIQSAGGGAYMLTFVIRVPYSPKGGGGGGGGGHGPPAPTLGTPMTGSAGLAYLVCALQVLCKPCQW